MSFWDVDGETVTPQAEYVAVTDKEPLPNKTAALVKIEDAGWKTFYQSDKEFLNLKVRLVKPYEGRVEFIKLCVKDLDPSAKDADKAKGKKKRHLGLLGAIDLAHKGKLTKSGDMMFTDEQLSLALIGGQFVCTFGLTTPNDQGKQYNYIMAAAPKTASVTEVEAAPKPAAKPKQPAWGDDNLDDDVPF